MSKSTRKIVAGLLTFAMVLTLVVGLAATPASAQTADFTRSLTVGSRGADVMQLQTILQAKGFFTVTPTGYFGAITKRAVAAWQASLGITPAAGYFGPISRAQIGGGVVVNPGGVAGCPAGAMYNYITGALCSTPTPSTSTTEGSLTVNRAPSVVSNSNITSNSDVAVYGLELKAKLGDVSVNRLDLSIQVLNGSSNENPGNFINTVKVWDGSTLVKSWAVGTADFNTGSTSAEYYLRLSNIGLNVPKDGTKNLVVSFSTNGGIDNNRTLTVTDYGSNPLMTVSGSNVVSYYKPAIVFTQVFAKPGTANLTVAADVSNPLSQTIRINKSSSSVTNATLLTFTVKSDTGESKITSVTAIATSSTTSGPTALYLYDGSTLLASQSLSAVTTAQTVTFNNLSLIVPNNTTKVLTITGDVQSTATDGTIASSTISSVSYQKPNGTSATVTSNIQGNNQYFYSVSPQWQLISANVSANPTINNQPSGLTATFVLKATPLGGTMTLPVVNDFVFNIASSASTVRLGAASSVQVVNNPTSLAEGAPYTITLTSNVASTSLTSGSYSAWFTISGATSTIGSTTTSQTWGLNNFQTAPITWSE